MKPIIDQIIRSGNKYTDPVNPVTVDGRLYCAARFLRDSGPFYLVLMARHDGSEENPDKIYPERANINHPPAGYLYVPMHPNLKASDIEGATYRVARRNVLAIRSLLSGRTPRVCRQSGDICSCSV